MASLSQSSSAGRHSSSVFMNGQQQYHQQQAIFIPEGEDGSELKMLPFPGPKSHEIAISPSPSAPTVIDGVLDITLHHARDIHNICIYGNQDVYAKFSITQTQGAVYSTQPVRGGGKNPNFNNQSLQILISKADAVLKCELWMMSCSKTYLEDQLLGFVLVPLSDFIGKGRLTKDFSLTSTDLFDTPAGVVCLSLMFYHRDSEPSLVLAPTPSLSEALMEHDAGDYHHVPNGHHRHQHDAMDDLNNVEFPDLHIASENQQLVSAYLKMTSNGDCDDMSMDDCSEHETKQHHQQNSSASFLQVSSSSHMTTDCEMETAATTIHGGGGGSSAVSSKDTTTNGGSGDKLDASFAKSNTSNGSFTSHSVDTPLSTDASSGTISLSASPGTISVSTTTTATTGDASILGAKPGVSVDMPTPATTPTATPLGGTGFTQTPSPTSGSSGGAISEEKAAHSSSEAQDSHSSFTTPLVSISLEPEEPMLQQQQIVDMYMKSMQQFTESLAKMKLPLDLDSGAELEMTEKTNPRSDKKGSSSSSSEATTKDGHRVFYGSRAFF